MELREFVSQTIAEVLEGVNMAATNPRYYGYVAPGHDHKEVQYEERPIAFDVNVTVEKSAKSGIKLLSVVEAGGELSHMTVHRVSFTVPVVMNVPLDWGGRK